MKELKQHNHNVKIDILSGISSRKTLIIHHHEP